MREILVVANQTAVGTQITRRVHELRGDDDEVSVFIVVPATPRIGRGQPRADSEGRPFYDPDGLERAAKQLRSAKEALTKAGAAVDGMIGPADPMRAVMLAAEGRDIERIIVSTLPVGMSRWIAMDLPHRLERRLGIPVDHVIGTEFAESTERRVVEGPIQVLLVEDQMADIELTKQALNEAGVPVDLRVAKNGAEAMAVMRTYGPASSNLILLDLKMPVLDGHEFLAQAGQEFDLDSLNIVVLTTSNSDEDREKAHALGARAYMVKDPDFDVFASGLWSLVNEVTEQ